MNLAEALIQEGKKDKARNVMHKCLDVVPSTAVPYHYSPPYQNDFPLIDTLLKLEMKEEAVQVITEMHHTVKQSMDYYLTFDYENNAEVQSELRQTLSAYYQISQLYNSRLPKAINGVREEFEYYYQQIGSLLNL